MKPGKKYIGRSIILMLALMVVTAVSCKKDDNKPVSPPSSSGPPANEVWIQGNNTYNPSSITVNVNTTVKWTNKDTYYTHTVTSNSGVFDSGSIPSGGTFSYTFTSAGTYPYHCNFHTMSGQVIVH